MQCSIFDKDLKACSICSQHELLTLSARAGQSRRVLAGKNANAAMQGSAATRTVVLPSHAMAKMHGKKAARLSAWRTSASRLIYALLHVMQPVQK